jgi:hypothetical protein
MAVKKIQNFLPLDDMLYIRTRSFEVADAQLIQPGNAVSLVDGEWVSLNSSGKLIRASAVGTPNDPSTVWRPFPIYTPLGSSDAMAMADPMLAVIFGGDGTEWSTHVFNAGVTIGGGAPITFRHQPLKVATITLTSAVNGVRNFSGLVGHGGAADTAPVVGIVTEVPTGNNPLKFVLSGRR